MKKAKTLNCGRKFTVAADVTYEAYYGREKSEWIHNYKPDKGCTGSYQFITLSIVLNGCRLILGYLPLRRGDRKEVLLEELLTRVLPHIPVDVVLLDRGFNSARVIRLLQRLRLCYLILWKKYECHREVFKSMGRRKFYRMKHERLIQEEQVTVETDMVFVKGIKVKGG